MSLKVDLLKLVERHDKIIIDVEFFKKAATTEEKEYTLIGTNFWEKAQKLIKTLQSWFPKHDILILGLSYTPTIHLSRYTVSFTVICYKDNKDYFIDRMKAIGRYLDFEFKETKETSRLA